LGMRDPSGAASLTDFSASALNKGEQRVIKYKSRTL